MLQVTGASTNMTTSNVYQIEHMADNFPIRSRYNIIRNLLECPDLHLQNGELNGAAEILIFEYMPIQCKHPNRKPGLRPSKRGIQTYKYR